ncbi:MAG: transposase [Gammaproteobacteria bacterium]|nr:transposase [Gammaproteobacteria bacterium]
MARPLRIDYPNAWHHVMNRGASKQLIFLNYDHRKMFLDLLNDVSQKFFVEIHAYCLMDNHYHLLVRTPESNLSQVMQYIDGVYTQQFNRCVKRDGALFRGRYKSILIEADAYLLQASRYIHLNPLEISFKEKFLDNKWSSYAAYIGLITPPEWLKNEFVLDMMHSKNPKESYENYVQQGVEPELIKFYSKKYQSTILGHATFKSQILQKLQKLNKTNQVEMKQDFKRTFSHFDITEILNSIARFYRKPTCQITQSQRGKQNMCRLLAIFICREVFGYSYKKISEKMGEISVNSLSSLIVRIKKMLATNEKLKNDYEMLLNYVKGKLGNDIVYKT